MKIIGKFKDTLHDSRGNGIVSFLIENFRYVSMLKDLDSEKMYSIEIKEVKSKRSIEQNKYLWALISEIDKEINGERSNDEWNIYIDALERCGAKCEFIGTVEEAEPLLKEHFRAVKRLYEIELDGGRGYMYKVYYGSSKLDTKEMTLLIDTVLDMASEIGLDTAYYSTLLKGN